MAFLGDNYARARAARAPLGFCAMVLTFAVLTYFGMIVFIHAQQITTVRPICGVALAICLIFGRTIVWRVLFAAAVSGLIVRLAFGGSVPPKVLSAGFSVVAVLATYYGAQRLLGPTVDFRKWKQLAGFTAISAAVSGVSGVLFAGPLYWIYGQHFWLNWQQWFVTTTFSFAVFTPAIVLAATMDPAAFESQKNRLACSLAILFVVLAVAFFQSAGAIFFVIPLALLVLTLIGEIEGTALALVLAEIVVTTATASGHGPAALGHLSLANQLYFTQTFLAALTLIMLPVAAAITERRQLHDKLVEALKREERASAALRDSERRYRAMAARADELNQAKSAFLASMSHELRTPLNAIIGFSEFMLTEPRGPLGHPCYGEYALDINRSGRHLLSLVNDILDLSRISAGKFELDRKSISIASVIGSVCSMVIPQAKKANIALACEVPNDLPSICADERRIQQIMINLISNAIKFTPEGGSVAIHAGAMNGYTWVEVRDTGIGIAQHDIAKVFEPFGQADNSRSRNYEGSGLGLPITKMLVELHGGAISLNSQLNAGTTVRVSFPIDQSSVEGQFAAA